MRECCHKSADYSCLETRYREALSHCATTCLQAMQAQNLMWPPAIATAVTSIANVGINLLLIRWFGFEGAAAAFSVTRGLLFLLLAGALTY